MSSPVFKSHTSSKFQLVLLLLILLTFLVFGASLGREVFEEFDGDFISHSTVSFRYSIPFGLSLIGMGLCLGFLVQKSQFLTTLLKMWPLIHFTLILLSLGFIGASAVLGAFAVISFVYIPANLIGEGISFGFLLQRLIFQRSEGGMGTIIALSLLNLAVIVFVYYKMSQSYLASLFM